MTGRRAAGSLRKRSGTWFLRYYANGRLIEESAKTGDERTARSLLVQRQREIESGTWRAPARRPDALTVGDYLDAWVKRRADNDVRHARNESGFFDRYVKPQIGDVPLVQLTRVHVRDLVTKLSATTSEQTDKQLAPRTVLHMYRSLSTAFAETAVGHCIQYVTP